MKHALFPFSVRSAPARTAAARSAFIRYIRVCASVLLSAALISCRPVPDAGGDTEITLVTYNAQTFFDSVTEGSEFREFRKADWNEGLYRTRLERLAGTLSAAAAIPDTEEKPAASGLTEFLQSLRRFAAAGRKLPDIAVLQEIENEEVLRDLTAFLPVPDFYPHILFVPAGKGSAFSTGILSVFPVASCTIHSIQDKSGVSLRPAAEVLLETGSGPLVLFAVHWKSKSGNNGSRGIRAAQEEVLAARIRVLQRMKPDVPFLVCGDFNQQPEEFTQLRSLRCAWDFLPAGAGTYFWRGNWEKIDNIFVSAHFTPGLESGANRFRIAGDGGLQDRDGAPYAFRIHTGQGFSDHLPLVFRFRYTTPQPSEARKPAALPNSTASSLSSGKPSVPIRANSFS